MEGLLVFYLMSGIALASLSPLAASGCTPYTVEAGDTCRSIGQQTNTTYAQLLAWNSDLDSGCSNLESLANGTICVSNPQGDYAMHTNSNGATSTSTPSMSSSTEPFNQTAATQLPGIGTETNYTSGGSPVIPIANNTRKECYAYFWTSNITDNAAADCWRLAMVYEITSEELILWNPSLAQNESTVTSAGTSTPTNKYTYPCTISESSSYCLWMTSPTPSPTTQAINTPSPRAKGEVAGCTFWIHPKGKYGTCKNLLRIYELSLTQFYAMNPSVKADCSGMNPGTYYCISTYPGGAPAGQPGWGSSSISVTSPSSSSHHKVTSTSASRPSTPSPIQTGMVGNCDEFYRVVKDDSCADIAKSHDIPVGLFYDWNPAVQTDCSGLQADTYVCVGISPSKPTGGATATITGVVTRTPVQTGITPHCTEFYFVQTDDTCYDIARAQGITEASLYQWNPALKEDCSGLQAKTYVCVGVAS